jgi:hypothetical protein
VYLNVKVVDLATDSILTNKGAIEYDAIEDAVWCENWLVVDFDIRAKPKFDNGWRWKQGVVAPMDWETAHQCLHHYLGHINRHAVW